MNLKAYYFPSMPMCGYGNPYSYNFKKSLSSYYDLLDKDNTPVHIAVWGLLKHIFSADVYFLNWIEGIGKHRMGIIQYIITILCLRIIRFRRKKIVWIVHNIYPHEGIDYCYKNITDYLYKNSSLIITHSKAALEHVSTESKCPTYYFCHPFNELKLSKNINKSDISYDVLIWGTINPYKGVIEFLEEVENRNSRIKIIVIGKAKDNELEEKILQISNRNQNILFVNKLASFDELSELVKSSKFTLFPYIGGSVSSSGALIDTLFMKGNPIGPNVGAFKDFQEEGLCHVYRNYDELFQIFEKSDNRIPINKIQAFIKNNSWDNFVKTITNLL